MTVRVTATRADNGAGIALRVYPEAGDCTAGTLTLRQGLMLAVDLLVIVAGMPDRVLEPIARGGARYGRTPLGPRS
jgi:hypothetical protein